MNKMYKNCAEARWKMKEKLYTIPVNEAFENDCECPICMMKAALEKNALEYTMGPSYMEDDVRAETDRLGFCKEHMQKLWEQNNRLGLALIIKTHMEKNIKEVKKLAKSEKKGGGVFQKFMKSEESPLTAQLNQLEHSCFICERMADSFERYLVTIYYLWKNEEEFRKKYGSAKGFCNAHYAMLMQKAPKHLTGRELEDFKEITSSIYIQNMERVLEDISWFINKFDYRYQEEPWKNAEDALPRALVKLNGILTEDMIEKINGSK